MERSYSLQSLYYPGPVTLKDPSGAGPRAPGAECGRQKIKHKSKKTGGDVKEEINGGQKAEGEKGEERGKATVTIPDTLPAFNIFYNVCCCSV